MTSPSPRFRWRRARRETAERRARLGDGGAVVLPVRARRTTSRGWGEWVDGRLSLPGPGDPPRATFVVDDPAAVALVTRQGEAPVVIEGPLDVSVRSVRYKAEAFHGTDAEIVVATTERRVVELALPREEVDPTARRLADLGPGLPTDA